MAYLNSAGKNLLLSGAAINYVNAADATNNAIGTNGNDWFNATTGTLKGGLGDDTYVYTGGQTVVEFANAGIDTVISYTIYAKLGANIENLVVTGNWGEGNELDNLIIGKGGAQTLDGGLGDDFLLGGADRDTFIIRPGEGSDTIGDMEVGKTGDVIRLDDSRFKTFADVMAATTQVGANTVVRLGQAQTLTLNNVAKGTLTADNFALPIDTGALKMVWADEFDALSLLNPTTNQGIWRTIFSNYGGGPGERNLPSEQQIYTDPWFTGSGKTNLGLNPFSVTNGVLNIHGQKVTDAQSDAMWGFDYSSGLITSKFSYVQTFGYFEVKAQLPSGQGMWPAFWLMPEDGSWPPELDVFEGLGTADQTFSTVHSKLLQGGSGMDSSFVKAAPTADGFHTYGVDWGRDTITWYVDGVKVKTVTTPEDLKKPMYMMINLALGGSWPGKLPADFASADMKIDYVHVYANKDTILSNPSTGPNAGKSVASPSAVPEPGPTTPVVDKPVATAPTTPVTTTPVTTTPVTTTPPVTATPPAPPVTTPPVVAAKTFVGTAANDTFILTSDRDVVGDGGAGIDLVSSAWTWTLGAGIENLTLTGSAAINGTGNELANTIRGNGANNILSGMDGNDTLVGGGGVDTMIGGKGDDTYYVDNAVARLTELAGGGIDKVVSSVTWTLDANFELLQLTGKANIDGFGNEVNNTLVGNEGNNRLEGFAGNDYLDGGKGDDTLVGGIGDDVYIVDSVNDRIIELVNEGNNDRVESSVTFTLAANVEVLTLTGTANINGYGNDGKNSLTGNDGNNILSGGGGNDYIVGGKGNDTLTGGAGADKFAFAKGSGSDVVTDFSSKEDTLDFTALKGVAHTVAQQGADTVITFSTGETVKLLGVTPDANLASHILWG